MKNRNRIDRERSNVETLEVDNPANYLPDGPDVATLTEGDPDVEQSAYWQGVQETPEREALPLDNWLPERLTAKTKQPEPTDRFHVRERSNGVAEVLGRLARSEPGRDYLTRSEANAANLNLPELCRTGTLEAEDPATPERLGVTVEEFSQAFAALYKNDPARKMEAAFRLADGMDGHPVLNVAQYRHAEAFRREILKQIEPTPGALGSLLEALENGTPRTRQQAEILLLENVGSFAGKVATKHVSRLLGIAENGRVHEAIRQTCLELVAVIKPVKSEDLFFRLFRLAIQSNSQDVSEAATKAVYAVCFEA